MQLLDTDGNRLRMPDFAGDQRVDLRFGTDARQNLYLLAKANGTVWKVVGTRNEQWPQRGREVAPGQPGRVLRLRAPLRGRRDDTKELDQGFSETLLDLVNGEKQMRVKDGAYPGSNNAIQTQQVKPTVAGNDDWKAGVWNGAGVPTLDAFRASSR